MNIYLFEMATEAYKTCNHIPDLKIPRQFVERLAELVAAEEREACAKACERINSIEDYYGERPELVCAQAIRARGQE
jgi:hypothetical protein